MTSSLSRRFALRTTIGFGLVFAPLALSAQSAPLRTDLAPVAVTSFAVTTPADVAPALDTAARVGPLVTPVALRHVSPRTALDLPLPEEHVGAGQNIAMMVVGAAAIVTGAIIGGGGGTAIAVGGGVIGLVGLYRYMK
jgi:hypothetical protein